MGQPIVVTEKPSIAHPGMVRFETNRALTGMGHERYTSAADTEGGTRPPDELARRLFAHGGVAAVHVNGNIVTVDLEKGRTSEGLAQVIEGLYIFYGEPEAEAGEPEAEAGEPEAEAGEPEAAQDQPIAG